MGFLSKGLQIFTFEDSSAGTQEGDDGLKAKEKPMPKAMTPLPPDEERIMTICLEKRVTAG